MFSSWRNLSYSQASFFSFLFPSIPPFKTFSKTYFTKLWSWYKTLIIKTSNNKPSMIQNVEYQKRLQNFRRFVAVDVLEYLTVCIIEGLLFDVLYPLLKQSTGFPIDDESQMLIKIRYSIQPGMFFYIKLDHIIIQTRASGGAQPYLSLY